MIVLVASVLALSWILVAKLYVAPNLASAYRGEGPPMLTQALQSVTQFRSGDSAPSHPLRAYQMKWNAVTWRILVGLLFTSAALALILRPECQRAIAAWQGSPEITQRALEQVNKLGKVRRFIVQATIVIIISASCLSILAGLEYWPFSHYRMYAKLRRGTSHTSYQFTGISLDGSEIAIEPRHSEPLAESRMAVAVRRMKQRSQPPEMIEKALQNVLERYEMKRLAGLHTDPPLKGLKLYRLTWELLPWASNAKQPEKTLMFQVNRASHDP